MELIPYLIALVICISILFYYSNEQRKEVKTFKEKLKLIYTREKQEYIITAVAFLSCIATYYIGQYLYHSYLFNTYSWQIAIGFLVPIAFIDFKKGIIPNKLLLVQLCLYVILISIELYLNQNYIVAILGTSATGAFLGGGVFLISYFISKGGMGAGDVKMYFVLGLLLGLRGTFNVMLYSMILSAVIGIVLLLLKKAKKSDTMPLAPFTLIAVVVSIVAGV